MMEIIDVMGSIIIGGIILLMLLSFNSGLMEGSAVQTFHSIVQSNLASLSDIVEYDFRKMGYRVGTVFDSAIVYADKDQIVMKGDIDNDGTVDQVSYTFDTKKKSGHVNPRSRILYRQVNNGPVQSINIGLTRFQLAYYDTLDLLIKKANPVADTKTIRAIRLEMTLESTSPYDTTYSGATWERTIAPKNLR
jgi:hypothetical protein